MGLNVLRLELINRRGRPTLDPDFVDEIMTRLQKADFDELVLTGGAGVFCQGVDFDSLVDEGAAFDGALVRYGELLSLLGRCPVPVISLVDGPALGGGLGLVAASDVVIASPNASFGMPELLLGVIPGVMFPWVAQRVGLGKARRMALLAETWSATEAHERGLVDVLAPDLNAALARVDRRLRAPERGAFAQIKELTAKHFGVPDAFVADAAGRFETLIKRPAAQKRIRSFSEGGVPWEDDDDA